MREHVITKLEAAHRQIGVAIQLYFSGDDVVAIHTLTCAAREIYEKHCDFVHIPRFFDVIRESHPDKEGKEIWSILNGARNFFKHPDIEGNLQAEISLSERDNKLMLFIACYDCAALCNDDTPLVVQAFNVWFLATEPDFPGFCAQGLEAEYPGVSSENEQRQKLIGRKFLEDVLARKFI